jgi:osmotically-inducible protein OsmY
MKMKQLTPFLLGGLLLVGVASCSDTAKTSSNAPNSTNDTASAPSADTAQTSQNDATGTVRQKQLESDTRAREQRNDAAGNQMSRADSDLANEVRDKLEANLPASQLTVKSEDGVVTVAGTVPTQDQLAKIPSLAQAVKGVKTVDVKATVAAAQPNTQ